MAGNLVKLFLQLGILFLYSRQLSIVTYGTYQSVWLYVNILSIAGLFGLPAMLLSSTTSAIVSWIRDHRKLFILLVLGLHLLPFTYLLFFSHFSITTGYLLIGITLVQNVSIIAEVFAIKYQKETRVLVSNLVFSIGYFLCHLLMLEDYSLDTLLAWLFIPYIIKTAILYTGNKQPVLSFATPQLGTQWLYLGLFDVVSVIFKWIDKWIILFFVSVSQFAIYYNGSYEIPVFALMLSAVGNIVLVELAGKARDLSHVKTIFIRSTLFLACIVFPSFAFLLFYHHSFFILIFSTKYLASIPVFIAGLFVLPVRIANYTAVLQSYHKSHIILKGAILDLLVAVLLLSFMYPIFGLPGLALAFVLSTYIQAYYYLWETAKLFGKKPGYLMPLRSLCLIMVAALTITGAGFMLSRLLGDGFILFPGIIVCLLLIAGLLRWYQLKMQKLITIL